MASETERLDRLLTKQERNIARAIRDYLAVVNSGVVAELITDLLEQGRAEDAIALLESYVAQMGNVLPDIWREVGQDAAEQLPKQLTTGLAVGISFDVTHPRAADLIRQNRLNFIVAFSDSQRHAVRQALARGAMTGAGPREVAQEFRNAIGLAPIQERAVANYRRLLEENRGEALSRELRDRRFDVMIGRAVERGEPPTPAQINLMVSRYRQNMIRMRAETIARREAHDAFSAAREEALEQMVKQTGLDRGRVIRIWNSTRDDRTRAWHESMQGQERGMGEVFEDGLGNALRRPGDPLAPAETIINCRCTTTWRLKQAA